MSEDDLLSLQEVAQILDVPPKTVHRWVKEGILIPVRSKGSLLFRPRDIQELSEKHHVGSLEEKKRILIIEDDPLVGDSLKNLLEGEGFVAVIASIGLAALDLAASEIFDLVIADVRMPGMDGIEALKAIRELQRQFGKSPVTEIILTAYDDPSVRDEAKRMGVQEFMLKPFEVSELLHTLKKHLRVVQESKSGGSE